MASIFNTHYSQNLDRLNSSNGESAPSKKLASKEGKEFARVLSDLEKKSDNVKSSGALAHSPQPAAPLLEELPRPAPGLTNLSPKESASALPLLNPALELEQKAEVSYDERLYQSVKLKPEPVKFLAPETVSTLVPVTTAEQIKPDPALGTPPMPVVAEIRRHAMPQQAQHAYQSPPSPKLLGTNRVRIDSDGSHTVQGADAMKEIIATAGKYYGIDPNLSMAVAQAESSFRPEAVSKDGHYSKGIFQLLDSTGKDMKGHTGLDAPYDPFDPAQNAYLGVGYLRRLHDIFSVETNLGGKMRTVPATSAEHLEKLAVAAFNAGEGNVARAQARARAIGKDPTDYPSVEPFLPASTRAYVQKVTDLREEFAAKQLEKKLA